MIAGSGCKAGKEKADATTERMMDAMTYMPLERLMDTVRRSDPAPRTGTGMSRPIPVLEDGRLQIAVFYYTSAFSTPEQAPLLSSPDRVVFFNAADGATVREEAVTNVIDLGSERFEIPRSEYPRLSAELFAAYDTLLPAFASGATSVPAEVKGAALTVKRLFPRFSGKLLAPYYQRIGRAWFTWLDQVTEGTEAPR